MGGDREISAWGCVRLVGFIVFVAPINYGDSFSPLVHDKIGKRTCHVCADALAATNTSPTANNFGAYIAQ